jgi:hypothetical protein
MIVSPETNFPSIKHNMNSLKSNSIKECKTPEKLTISLIGCVIIGSTVSNTIIHLKLKYKISARLMQVFSFPQIRGSF